MLAMYSIDWSLLDFLLVEVGILVLHFVPRCTYLSTKILGLLRSY